MAACFTIKNPQDAAIYVTGLSASNSWPCPRPQTHGPTQTPSTPSLHTRRHSDKSLQLSPGYRPVLAVTRRSLPTADTTHGTVAVSENQDSRFLSADPTFRELRNGSFKQNAPSTLGRPLPPCNVLKSKSSLMSRDTSTKSRSSFSFLSKSKVDLRTGFMRSLSRPTPGELDLKHHRDLQDSRRRERDGEPDLDKLNMTEIMRMLKSKSPVQTGTTQDTTPTSEECQKFTNTQERDSDDYNAVQTDSVHGQSPKTKLKAPLFTHEIPCEPPLVSNKHKNKDHKLRLQALYSQYNKYGLEDVKSHEISTQGRTSKDHDRKVAEQMARRPSRPSEHENRMRVNILSLESFGDETGEFTGDVYQTSSSESCSEQSSWSGSGGERYTPRNAGAPLLHPDSSHGEQGRQCPRCKGAQSGKRTRSTRRVRYAEPVVAPSPDGNGSRGIARMAGRDLYDDPVQYFDLEPHHYKIPFAEYISISHPMRPPANSPVSVLSEDEGDHDLLNMHERQSDQWSLSYHAKSAPTRASSASGFIKGQVKVESHGSNKATIDIFLPQMT
ncbi:uncharacterized protein LOC119722821 isoform X2 [Patiria miniata]|nr:uncharacterized protein LOC119722821 isoform X2 [Patiria miniata]